MIGALVPADERCAISDCGPPNDGWSTDSLGASRARPLAAVTSSIDAAIVPLLAALDAPGGSAVVVAPPGTGKTTRLPLALLDAHWASLGRIVLLEPRRLATRAAARRMSSLLGDEVGGIVGYVTRDERRVGPRTRIEVVTEGVLTRRLQRDPELNGTALVIFDEIHERNLQTDLGLALVLDARNALRPDLRLCAMSATVAADRFAELIGAPERPAPVVAVGGEPFPIEVRWVPRKPSQRLEPAVASAVEAAVRREIGDVLVFLPGVREITQVGQLLDGLPAAGVDVHPLYGALSAEQQDDALLPSPPGRRRVVLATDIAESSLTVEGVRIVVDAGLARSPRYDPRTGMTRLQTVSISRASTEQRAGRAGRLGPGVVYRLWSKGEQAVRRPFGEAEILQVDLAGFVLELSAWGVADPGRLSFIDPPPVRTLADARELLAVIGAIDSNGLITRLGRAMNDLPLHPRLAAMVARAVDGGDRHRVGLACVIGALLEERDVMRGRPDELPTDLATRIELVGDATRRHPQADGRAVATARRRAGELIRRVGVNVDVGDVAEVPNLAAVAELLAVAYPDRLAVRRSQVGRFQLPTGTAAWVPNTDPLGREAFLIVADLDGDRREARIRLAAPLDAHGVSAAFGTDVSETTRLTWDTRRDELVEVVERKLGSAVLDEISRRPEPGPFVIDALMARVRERGVGVALNWTQAAESMRARVTFCHSILGDPWPDWSMPTLTTTLDTWLAPFLIFASGRTDMAALDPGSMLSATLDPRWRADLERLAPAAWTNSRGRPVTIDYGAADPAQGVNPVLAVKVQEMFGTVHHPTVLDGRVPLLLHLLSPAGRPLQITADLPGFWAGSWAQVRKDMAGRYPKHAWPADPTSAAPPSR